MDDEFTNGIGTMLVVAVVTALVGAECIPRGQIDLTAPDFLADQRCPDTNGECKHQRTPSLFTTPLKP